MVWCFFCLSEEGAFHSRIEGESFTQRGFGTRGSTRSGSSA